MTGLAVGRGTGFSATDLSATGELTRGDVTTGFSVNGEVLPAPIRGGVLALAPSKVAPGGGVLPLRAPKVIPSGGVLDLPPSNNAAREAVLSGRAVPCVEPEPLRSNEGRRAGEAG
jgi:hypothetical protein